MLESKFPCGTGVGRLRLEAGSREETWGNWTYLKDFTGVFGGKNGQS